MEKRHKNTAFTGIGNLLKNYIKENSRTVSDGFMHVVEIWPSLSDKNISENSKPDSVKNGILTLKVLSPGLSQHIMLLKKNLIKEINTKAEAAIVRDIKCRVTGTI